MGVEPENDMPDYLGFGQNMGVNLTYLVQDEGLDLADATYSRISYGCRHARRPK
jgi:dTDP-glucose pyrophosphorylase